LSEPALPPPLIAASFRDPAGSLFRFQNRILRVVNPAGVDPRGDLYSLGAVGYWLLTGSTLFDSTEIQQLLDGHVNNPPKLPSERLGRQIQPGLERIIMSCLSKNPDSRPPSAEALETALAGCAPETPWSNLDAEKWWAANLPKMEPVSSTPLAQKTLVIAARP
jgi:serine/threonine protein kinase